MAVVLHHCKASRLAGPELGIMSTRVRPEISYRKRVAYSEERPDTICSRGFLIRRMRETGSSDGAALAARRRVVRSAITIIRMPKLRI
jgi:hypothetical protein